MFKNRPLLLILVCAGLAALVWLDNRREGDEGAVRVARPPAVEEAADSDAAEHANAEEVIADAQEDAGSRGEDEEDQPGGLQLSNPLATFDKDSLKDWVERPLFAPSRKRPPQSADTNAPTQVAAAPLAPNFDLLGIVREDSRALALLRKKGDGASFRVEVGDMIGGWRVAKIEPSAVVLERADGVSQTLPLQR